MNDTQKHQAADSVNDYLTLNREQNSPWLTFEEVRQKLRVSEKVLRRELVEERIPATRIGQKIWRIHRDDLDRALRERAS